MSLDGDVVRSTLVGLGYTKEESLLLFPCDTPRRTGKRPTVVVPFNLSKVATPQKNQDHLSTFDSHHFSSKLGKPARPAHGSSKYRATGRGGTSMQPPASPTRTQFGPFLGLPRQERSSTLPATDRCSSMRLGTFYRECWKKNRSVGRLSVR